MILKNTSMLFAWNHINMIFLFNKKFIQKRRVTLDVEQKKHIDTVSSFMICKFVFDGSGKKLGESVSIVDDVLIIKSSSRFLGVPLKHVEALEKEKSLLVKGLIDFTKAYELGEKWRKESYREMTQHDSQAEKATKLF